MHINPKHSVLVRSRVTLANRLEKRDEMLVKMIHDMSNVARLWSREATSR